VVPLAELLSSELQRTAPETVPQFHQRASRWFEGSRSVKAARPDQQGQWQVKALPPGEYLAIALEYVEDGSWNDPDYLESLRKLATAITLAEGGTETAALKLATPK